MVELIDKSALVVEIEKRKIPFKRDIEDGNYPTYLCALMDFEDLLDTLEVKEVDLEKKKIEWIEQLCKYFKANYLYVSGHESFISDFRRYAKDLK